jgi:DNA (cytosine-5)-methyltransferase 1
VTQRGTQQNVVAAFVSRQFGTSTGHEMARPLATTTADGGGKSMLVAPFLQKYYGTGDGSRHDEPCHTVTVKDRHGHVEAFLDVPPFTEAQAARARQVADFMRAHGLWDEREFVTIDVDGVTLVIVDIGMRMLTPRELYNAQGFPRDYVIDGGWAVPEGGGEPVWVPFSKSLQVSCVGNSVSPPVARALVAANCNHLMTAEGKVAA